MAILESIPTFYELFKLTVGSLERIDQWKAERERTITALRDQIEKSELKYGDPVRVRGIFSDFVPIGKDAVFEPDIADTMVMIDTLASKPFPIDDFHCALLQEDYTEYAGNPNGLPIFYEMDTPRPIATYLTGEMVTIDGKLISLPDGWGRFLDVNSNVGIYARDIQTIGEQKQHFGIDYWSIIRDQETDLDIGSGLFMFADDLRLITSRLDHERVLLVHSFGNEFRHGEPEYNAENVLEFHRSNFMDDELHTSQVDFLEASTKDSMVDACWDMTRSSEQMTDWIQNQI